MSSLSDLNDDCVLHLLHYLQPEELLALEDVSVGLRHLAFQFYRLCRQYEWTKQRQKVNTRMIERIGGSLRELVYRGIGSTDIECFSAVNCYCQRIERLTLFDVTVDMNLLLLLMPVLDHLKHLHIDRYLMYKTVRVQGPLNEGEEPSPEDTEDSLSDIQCLMLCAVNLNSLFIGEPFDKDSFMSHEYLSTLLNLRYLTLNLTRNISFAEFGDYFSHSFLPLESLELILPNEGVTDYDKFCDGLENLQHLKNLTLNNLQNKHFWFLVPGVRRIVNLQVLKLNCAQGVNLSKSVQRIFTRIDNKTLRHVTLSSIKNSSLQFLWTLRWWANLRSFEIVNCETFKNDDLLQICSRVTNKFVTMSVKDCSLSPEIVHLLVKISKLRIYNLTFNFYHLNEGILAKFQKETDRTIIQYIHVNNYLSE